MLSERLSSRALRPVLCDRCLGTRRISFWPCARCACTRLRVTSSKPLARPAPLYARPSGRRGACPIVRLMRERGAFSQLISMFFRKPHSLCHCRGCAVPQARWTLPETRSAASASSLSLSFGSRRSCYSAWASPGTARMRCASSCTAAMPPQRSASSDNARRRRIRQGRGRAGLRQGHMPAGRGTGRGPTLLRWRRPQQQLLRQRRLSTGGDEKRWYDHERCPCTCSTLFGDVKPRTFRAPGLDALTEWVTPALSPRRCSSHWCLTTATCAIHSLLCSGSTPLPSRCPRRQSSAPQRICFSRRVLFHVCFPPELDEQKGCKMQAAVC